MKKLLMTTMVSAAALGLAACDSEDVENTPVDDIDEILDEDEPYPVGGELNEDQQANYDAMDRQAVSDEYDANMEAMQSDMDSGGMSDGSMDGSSTSGSGSMENDGMSDDDSMSGGASMDDGDASSGSSQSSMPARSQMSFSYLDRNGDGQLSVAEYAIWALPTDPNPPEPNDALAPHLTQDQINQAGQTFFYFDDDGDSYLSQEEFQDARNSGRTA